MGGLGRRRLRHQGGDPPRVEAAGPSICSSAVFLSLPETGTQNLGVFCFRAQCQRGGQRIMILAPCAVSPFGGQPEGVNW